MDHNMEESLPDQKAAPEANEKTNQQEADPGEGSSRQHHRGPFTTIGGVTSTSTNNNDPEDLSELKTIFLYRKSKSEMSLGGSSNSSTSDLSGRTRDDYSQHSDDGIAYDNRSESSSDEGLLNAVLAMGLVSARTHPVFVSEAQRSEGVLDLRKKLDEEKEYRGPIKRQQDDKDKEKEPSSSSKKSKRKD